MRSAVYFVILWRRCADDDDEAAISALMRAALLCHFRLHRDFTGRARFWRVRWFLHKRASYHSLTMPFDCKLYCSRISAAFLT